MLEQYINRPVMGVCYYPEHWDETLWEDDLTRMRACGITVARVAEFAWNRFEPQEGVFDFSFFDRFLELAYRTGVQIIFCTPTATPPAWLTEAYPETLNADMDGNLFRHGMRQHHNHTSPKYLECIRRLVMQLAEHYCPHPAIIGWQIDNEINCEINRYFAESDHQGFRNYLKEKFQTLERLNECLGTAFWNQTYTSWNEIYLPRKTIHNSPNPHLALEEKRFISDAARRYIKLQADIVRQYLRPDQFITTNGLFNYLDYHTVTEESLDFITYDCYPNFAYDTAYYQPSDGAMRDRNASFNLARARCISPVFGIMEQQAGGGGWNSRMMQPEPKPGQMRLWALQAFAHGADFISFFRWRTSWIGTEIYWHGINDYANRGGRRLEELKQIRIDLDKLVSVAGESYRAEVAIVKDYDNEWDADSDIWVKPLRDQSTDAWFIALQKQHVPFDFLYLRQQTSMEDLHRYQILIYPHPAIVSEKTAQMLEQYVARGGTLILGARTGYKDIYGRCPMMVPPGYLRKLCGLTVEEITLVHPADGNVQVNWNGTLGNARHTNEILCPDADTKTLAVYIGGFYVGRAALTEHMFGKGRVLYFGAAFDSGMAGALVQYLGAEEPFRDWIVLPPEAELAVRGEVLFVLNYMPYTITVAVRCPMQELFGEIQQQGEVAIEPFGVRAYQWTERCDEGKME